MKISEQKWCIREAMDIDDDDVEISSMVQKNQITCGIEQKIKHGYPDQCALCQMKSSEPLGKYTRLMNSTPIMYTLYM